MAAVPEAVRLVRCPKCWKLLPEILNIPVYQCGGCHTMLLAKFSALSEQTRDHPEASQSAEAEKNTTLDSVKTGGDKLEVKRDEKLENRSCSRDEEEDKDIQPMERSGVTGFQKEEKKVENLSCSDVKNKDTRNANKQHVEQKQGLLSANCQTTTTIDTEKQSFNEILSETLNINGKSPELACSSLSDASQDVDSSEGMPGGHYGLVLEASSRNPSCREEILLQTVLHENTDRSDKEINSGKENLEALKTDTRLSHTFSTVSEGIPLSYESLATLLHASTHPSQDTHADSAANVHETIRHEETFDSEPAATGYHSSVSERESARCSPGPPRNGKITAAHKSTEIRQFTEEVNPEYLKTGTTFNRSLNSRNLKLSHHRPLKVTLKDANMPKPAEGKNFKPSNVPLTAQRLEESSQQRNSKGIRLMNQEGYGDESPCFSHGVSAGIQTRLLMQERLELLRKLDELKEQVYKQCDLPSVSNVQMHPINRRSKHMPKENQLAVHETIRNTPFGCDKDILTFEDDVFRLDEVSEHLRVHSHLPSIPDYRRCCEYLNPDCKHCLMEIKHKNVPSTFHTCSCGSPNFGFLDSSAVEKKGVPMPLKYSHSLASGEKQGQVRPQPHHVSHQSMDFLDKTFCDDCPRDRSFQKTSFSHAFANRNSSHQNPIKSISNFRHPQVPWTEQETCCGCGHSICHRESLSSTYEHANRYPEQSSDKGFASEDNGECLLEKFQFLHKPNVTKWKNLLFTPFAGAMPFVLCANCLRLLLIPEKPRTSTKRCFKIRCGACSHVFEFSFQRNSSSVPLHEHPSSRTAVLNKDAFNVDDRENMDDSHDCSCVVAEKQNSSHNAYNLDVKEYIATSKNGQSTAVTSGVMHSTHLSPKARKLETSSTFNIIHHTKKDRKRNFSADGSRGTREISESMLDIPLAGYPLHAHLGYASPTEMLNRCHEDSLIIEKYLKDGNLETSGYETIFDRNIKHRLIHPTKTFLSGTEIVGSFNVRNHDRLPTETNKNKNLAISTLLKSIKDFKKGNHLLEVARPKVTINGKPVPDHLVRKAEEYAGPIHPGDYWYDYIAGFWGVMGEPCLGIIPPFIEEFNFPMPRNCAGGQTRILVNGRELHQKDLNLLAGRGLPIVRDMEYYIDISGRVVDMSTNMELKGLGKLASTLEKIGRGSGMKPLKKKASRQSAVME